MKISKLGDVLIKVVLPKGITNGGLGVDSPAAVGYKGVSAKPPDAEQFFVNF